MKILGLDVGEKRIGLAIAEGKLVATYGVVNFDNLAKVTFEISQIIRKENIQKVVIGLPENKDTLQKDKIHSFSQRLAKEIQIPIAYENETLTSAESERLLVHIKEKKSLKFKKEVDKLSAKLILEQYLAKNKK